jgi:hypothetical protein
MSDENAPSNDTWIFTVVGVAAVVGGLGYVVSVFMNWSPWVAALLAIIASGVMWFIMG